MKILILILFAGVLVFLLVQGQQRMIYYPRTYDNDLRLPDRYEVLEFQTGQGRQAAFYQPPADARLKLPERLWLICGGNASLALDWVDFLEDFPDSGAAFLLLDYPGYGSSLGRPGPATILESIEKALPVLANRLGISRGELDGRLMVMGHSLGAAAVLLYAGRHPVARMVLISPFTSLRELAARLVGSLPARALLYDYDNRARLREVLGRKSPPPITIIHGDRDEVIPLEMGRELASLSPAINFVVAPNGDHNYIFVTARDDIFRAMLGSEPR